jgi:hypothetical protein
MVTEEFAERWACASVIPRVRGIVGEPTRLWADVDVVSGGQFTAAGHRAQVHDRLGVKLDHLEWLDDHGQHD